MGMRVPQAPPRRDVTREFVEARLEGVMVLKPGQELIHVGWRRPLEPRVGQAYFDEDTGEQYVYTGAEWQVLRSDTDLFVPQMAGVPWCCAYCGTHHGEQRCPTCGAGRTKG